MINNKRGNIRVIILIGFALFMLLFVGFMMVIGSSTINYVMDIIFPEIISIGMVGDANVSQAVTIAVTPVNDFIQNLTWMTGIIYVFGIFGIFGLAFAFKGTGDKWLMAFFLGLVLILVISSIFMSNIYEEFYNDSGELSDRLHEHIILSFLILYSPAVVSIIAFLSGIILFSGDSGGFE